MISTTICYFLIVLFSFTVNVNCQTCESGTEYDSCSTNSGCGCLPLTFANNIGICGLLTCSRFTSCQLNDVCQEAEHICVRHPRCSLTPVCFPLTMVDQRLCPPLEIINTTRPSIIVSNCSGALTIDDGIYTRPGSSGSFYYQAIQIMVGTSGTYDLKSLSGVDTHGYLYNGTFYPTSPTLNQINHDDDGGGNGQFKLTHYLEAGVPYTLVVTTHSPGGTAAFSVVGSGPDDIFCIPLNPVTTTTTTSTTTTVTTSTTTTPFIIVSNCSGGALTTEDGRYTRPGGSGSFYYEAIQIMVGTSGIYDLKSLSGMDTHGYLYNGTFYPTNPTLNQINHDDDSGGSNQFKLTHFLEAGVPYTLVVTTHGAGTTGAFSVVGSGPDDIFCIPLNPVTTTTTTSTTTTVTTSTTTTTTPFIIISNCSDAALTTEDGIYTRPGGSGSFYYQAIQIMVGTSGTYDLKSLSGMDTHGYLYNGTFYPTSPTLNQIDHDDDGGDNRQFKLTHFLEAFVPYTLVVTTHSPGTTGAFSVVGSGPDEIFCNPLDPVATTTTTSTTTRPSIINSNYTGALTLNSSTFTRANMTSGNFSYQAIQVNVNTTGRYTFTCSSGMDTFGYLYQGNFYPFYPSLNIVAQNDDMSTRDFQVTADLRSDITYILVATTFNEGAMGPFSIIASGPDDVSLIPINI